MAYNSPASLKGRMHSETRRPTFRRGDTSASESSPLLPATNGVGPPRGRSGGEPDAPAWVAYPRHALWLSWEVLRSNYVNVLLVFVPLGIAAGELGWGAVTVFSLNFLAIIPLASLLSFATEELAAEMGQTIGGLCNASFGNAVELIVRSLSPLVDCRLTVV
jgi:Ca2+:H+ antiporter